MFPLLLLPLLRRFGAVGALLGLARTPMGRRLTAQAKSFLSDPTRRRQFTDAARRIGSRPKTP